MRKIVSISAKILCLLLWQMDAVFRLYWPQTVRNMSHAETVEARIFFFGLAVFIAMMAYQSIDNFFEFVFFELAIYNIGDEAMGMGSTYQWHELPVAIFAMLFAWLKFSGIGNHLMKIIKRK